MAQTKKTKAKKPVAAKARVSAQAIKQRAVKKPRKNLPKVSVSPLTADISTAPEPKRRKKWLIIGAFTALVVLVGLTVLIWNYIATTKELNRLKDPEQAAASAQTELLAEVGKVIVLPKGETPTIATVSDATKLQDKEFFKNAQNGDKVLVYQKSKRAFIYRPSDKLVVNVATLSDESEATPITP